MKSRHQENRMSRDVFTSFDPDSIRYAIEVQAIAAIRAHQERWNKPKQLVRNGQWVSGCTAERPKGWQGMKVMEVEAC